MVDASPVPAAVNEAPLLLLRIAEGGSLRARKFKLDTIYATTREKRQLKGKEKKKSAACWSKYLSFPLDSFALAPRQLYCRRGMIFATAAYCAKKENEYSHFRDQTKSGGHVQRESRSGPIVPIILKNEQGH